MKKVELLAPAGNMEKLRFAVRYGADAVYIGVDGFSLRAGAGNFKPEEIGPAVEFARLHGVRVYAAVNIFARDADLEPIESAAGAAIGAGVDALIVSDPGVFNNLRKSFPEARIHISTQANNLNKSAVEFWGGLGASRVTLARELSLAEITEISGNATIESEVFVHGAMCIAYSGRCYLSRHMASRDANRGDCAHSCRWRYGLVEEKRSAELFGVEVDNSGFYVFNSKDLCLAEYLPQLIEAGVTSLKIEGRMKSLHYLATVVRVYRSIIDEYYRLRGGFVFKQEWLDELEKVSHRPYTAGFLFDGEETVSPVESKYIKNYDFVGVTGGDSDGRQMTVKVRNRIGLGDPIEILQADGTVIKTEVRGITIEGAPVGEVHANTTAKLAVTGKARAGSIVRRVASSLEMAEIAK